MPDSIDPTIRVDLTTHELRAVAYACEFTRETFGIFVHEGIQEDALGLAHSKLLSVLERGERDPRDTTSWLVLDRPRGLCGLWRRLRDTTTDQDGGA